MTQACTVLSVSFQCMQEIPAPENNVYLPLDLATRLNLDTSILSCLHSNKDIAFSEILF